MTAGRLLERDELAEEIEAEAPWVNANEHLHAADADDVAPVVPIESPRIKAVVAKLADALDCLDSEDLSEMVSDLKPVLRSGDLRNTIGVLDAWRVTAESLRDPIARSVLLGDVSPDDFKSVEIGRAPVR